MKPLLWYLLILSNQSKIIDKFNVEDLQPGQTLHSFEEQYMMFSFWAKVRTKTASLEKIIQITQGNKLLEIYANEADLWMAKLENNGLVSSYVLGSFMIEYSQDDQAFIDQSMKNYWKFIGVHFRSTGVRMGYGTTHLLDYQNSIIKFFASVLNPLNINFATGVKNWEISIELMRFQIVNDDMNTIENHQSDYSKILGIYQFNLYNKLNYSNIFNIYDPGAKTLKLSDDCVVSPNFINENFFIIQNCTINFPTFIFSFSDFSLTFLISYLVSIILKDGITYGENRVILLKRTLVKSNTIVSSEVNYLINYSNNVLTYQPEFIHVIDQQSYKFLDAINTKNNAYNYSKIQVIVVKLRQYITDSFNHIMTSEITTNSKVGNTNYNATHQINNELSPRDQMEFSIVSQQSDFLSFKIRIFEMIFFMGFQYVYNFTSQRFVIGVNEDIQSYWLHDFNYQGRYLGVGRVGIFLPDTFTLEKDQLGNDYQNCLFKVNNSPCQLCKTNHYLVNQLCVFCPWPKIVIENDCINSDQYHEKGFQSIQNIFQPFLTQLTPSNQLHVRLFLEFEYSTDFYQLIDDHLLITSDLQLNQLIGIENFNLNYFKFAIKVVNNHDWNNPIKKLYSSKFCGTILIENGIDQECKVNCDNGYIIDKGQCIKSLNGCLSVSTDFNNCNTCSQDYIKKVYQNLSQEYCSLQLLTSNYISMYHTPSYQQLQQGSITNCSVYNQNDLTQCIACKLSYYLRNNECSLVSYLPIDNCIQNDNSKCTQCDSGYKYISKLCLLDTQCNKNQKSYFDNKCYDCPQGFVITSQNQCILCNQQDPLDPYQCQQCSGNHILENNICYICQDYHLFKNLLLYSALICSICPGQFSLFDSNDFQQQICISNTNIINYCQEYSSTLLCTKCNVNYTLIQIYQSSQLCILDSLNIQNCSIYLNILTCQTCDVNYTLVGNKLHDNTDNRVGCVRNSHYDINCTQYDNNDQCYNCNNNFTITNAMTQQSEQFKLCLSVAQEIPNCQIYQRLSNQDIQCFSCSNILHSGFCFDSIETHLHCVNFIKIQGNLVCSQCEQNYHLVDNIEQFKLCIYQLINDCISYSLQGYCVSCQSYELNSGQCVIPDNQCPQKMICLDQNYKISLNECTLCIPYSFYVENCLFYNDLYECNECLINYILFQNKCYKKQEQEYCEKYLQNQCIKCDPKHYLKDGKCKECKEKFENCQICENDNCLICRIGYELIDDQCVEISQQIQQITLQKINRSLCEEYTNDECIKCLQGTQQTQQGCLIKNFHEQNNDCGKKEILCQYYNQKLNQHCTQCRQQCKFKSIKKNNQYIFSSVNQVYFQIPQNQEQKKIQLKTIENSTVIILNFVDQGFQSKIINMADFIHIGVNCTTEKIMYEKFINLKFLNLKSLKGVSKKITDVNLFKIQFSILISLFSFKYLNLIIKAIQIKEIFQEMISFDISFGQIYLFFNDFEEHEFFSIPLYRQQSLNYELSSFLESKGEQNIKVLSEEEIVLILSIFIQFLIFLFKKFFKFKKLQNFSNFINDILEQLQFFCFTKVILEPNMYIVYLPLLDIKSSIIISIKFFIYLFLGTQWILKITKHIFGDKINDSMKLLDDRYSDRILNKILLIQTFINSLQNFLCKIFHQQSLRILIIFILTQLFMIFTLINNLKKSKKHLNFSIAFLISTEIILLIFYQVSIMAHFQQWNNLIDTLFIFFWVSKSLEIYILDQSIKRFNLESKIYQLIQYQQ